MCSLGDSSPGLPLRGGETRCCHPSYCSEPVTPDYNTRPPSRLCQKVPRWMQTYYTPRWRWSRAEAQSADVVQSLSSCTFPTAKFNARRGKKCQEEKRCLSLPPPHSWMQSQVANCWSTLLLCLGGQIHPRVNGREERTDWDVLCARSTGTARRVQLVKLSRVAGVRGNGQAGNERCAADSGATAIYKPTEWWIGNKRKTKETVPANECAGEATHLT